MVSVAIIYCSLFTLNMWSARYMWLSGIIVDRTSFCVVAFSNSAACETLIPHRLLKPFGVVFKCLSADKKARGCLLLVGSFGGYGTVLIWMSFTSFSVTSLAICCYSSLVALSITIARFSYIWTLANSLWLKHFVFNMMYSSSAIWRSSSSIEYPLRLRSEERRIC